MRFFLITSYLTFYFSPVEVFSSYFMNSQLAQSMSLEKSVWCCKNISRSSASAVWNKYFNILPQNLFFPRSEHSSERFQLQSAPESTNEYSRYYSTVQSFDHRVFCEKTFSAISAFKDGELDRFCILYISWM